jgi:hypothetical protein
VSWKLVFDTWVFILSQNNYRKEDWRWLLRKFDKCIGNWCYRWLSLGGRYVLSKSVLEILPVYWLSLSCIPKSVLNLIRRIFFYLFMDWE